jgi:hypothetical protein
MLVYECALIFHHLDFLPMLYHYCDCLLLTVNIWKNPVDASSLIYTILLFMFL